MATAHLYFDESGTHADSSVMSIAGYWFEAEQAARFARDWQKDLDSLGLTHAHMTDCALGYGEYKHLSMTQRVQSEKLLIEHIKRRSRMGFAITLNPHAYKDAMSDVAGAPTAYSFCLMLLFQSVVRAARSINYKGSLKYHFESGHESAAEANRYLDHIPKHGKSWVEYSKYAGHVFVDKKVDLPLQAADMLAWQTRHYYKRMIEGVTRPRKDFVALVRRFDLTTIVGLKEIEIMRDAFLNLAPLTELEDKTAAAKMLAQIYNRWNLTEQPMPKLR